MTGLKAKRMIMPTKKELQAKKDEVEEEIRRLEAISAEVAREERQLS